MLKLSNTMKNAAFAGLLTTGLVGSATVMLTPAAARAQQWHRDWDDRGFRRDVDGRAVRGDWDDRYHRDWDDRWRFGVGVGGVGVGVYGYPYYYPYYSGYYSPYYYSGTYCSSYDDYYSYCSY